MSLDIGIDIGAAYISVYGKDEGIVLKEPAVIACDRESKEVKAVGKEAYSLIGRNAGNIVTSYIYDNNIYMEEDIMLEVIKYIVTKVIGKIKIIRPVMCISVHTCAGKECMNMIKECAFKAGAREAVVIESSMAAAIGAGVDIKNTPGNIVVEIGEKLSEIIVISNGKVIKKEELKVTGSYFDEYITEYIRKRYGVIIGRGYAKYIRQEYGDFNSFAENIIISVKGRSIDDSLLCEVFITSNEIKEEYIKVVDIIVEKLKEISGKIDKSIKNNILSRGVIITGSGAMIPGFERLMEEKIQIPVMVPDNADKSRVTGTGIVLEYLGGIDQ